MTDNTASSDEKGQHDCPCDWRCHVDGRPCCAACQQAELAIRAKSGDPDATARCTEHSGSPGEAPDGR